MTNIEDGVKDPRLPLTVEQDGVAEHPLLVILVAAHHVLDYHYCSHGTMELCSVPEPLAD